jgi:hypothetical protein
MTLRALRAALGALIVFQVAAAPAETPEPRRVTRGVYTFSVAAKEEGTVVTPFESGLLTDGNSEKGVNWMGKNDAPRKAQIVFDLLRDYPLEQVVIETRHPNKHKRNDRIVVEGRAQDETTYRVLLPEQGAGNPAWTRLEIPLQGRSIRYLRIELGRRHVFVEMPLTEVTFLTKVAAAEGQSAVPVNLAAEFQVPTPMVDTYGQYLYEDWAGKVTSDAQFTQDLAAERAALEAAGGPSRPLDSYGGFRDTLALKATGFFRLEKVDGRWWFVTPEGNPFFMNGIDTGSPHDWGYSTGLKNAAGQARGSFVNLPDATVFKRAYTTQEGEPRVNFILANLQRKFGADYEAGWTELMRKRLQVWGFNANAKWTRSESLNLPYITVLRPAKGVRRIKWAVDPYDDEFATQVESGVAKMLKTAKDNPNIIGHTFESEKGWDFEVVAAMLKLTEPSPAKAAFIDHLYTRLDSDAAKLAQLLETSDVSKEALQRTALPFPEDLHPYAREFILEASKRYYRIATEIIRRHDPNHVILGSSLTPDWHNSHEWSIGAVGYTDALSFDHYKEDAEWLEPYLAYDLPILLLEYGFVVNGRGLADFSSAVPTQRDRGLGYRRLIEGLAARPQFVGAGWFMMYDQAVTGRGSGGSTGERHNFGLLNQQDQPYVEMLEEMRKTNERIYEVHSGQVEPFTLK